MCTILSQVDTDVLQDHIVMGCSDRSFGAFYFTVWFQKLFIFQFVVGSLLAVEIILFLKIQS